MVSSVQYQDHGEQQEEGQKRSFTNLLIHEKSPYLLQHAHNPVAWRAWNEESFAVAQQEDKPIFLSIGYATCHWCHVMEHESFEHEEIADIINQHFIAIKVDREERPDIDAVYMAVCQAMTGQGGWPLTIFMTADQKPFFAGTYFPREDHPQRPGFRYLLKQIAMIWQNDRTKIDEAGEIITRQLRQRAEASYHGDIPRDIMEKSVAGYQHAFDHEYGGFGSRPKFPSPHNLLFLLREYHHTKQENLLAMVEKTLTAMRMGGLFDHLGGGFHRYSTDREWILPHFEKMLYDQAMLMMAYTECFQVTGNRRYATIAEEIGEYVLRDMQSPDGGFYCAEDADSIGHDGKKEEGKFYVWTEKELYDIVGQDDGRLFAQCYNVESAGNFQDEATQQYTGENILYQTHGYSYVATHTGIQEEELVARLSMLRARLFTAREHRPRPLRDEKILADWNGLMIAALAQCGSALGNSLFIASAEKAWRFIRTALCDGDTLYHRYCDGERAVAGFLDDYACMAYAGLALYDATHTSTYLTAAIQYSEILTKNFYDSNTGGFYFVSHLHEQLITQTKEAYDGASPSGNSIACYVLVRLGKLLQRSSFLNIAEHSIQAFGKAIQSYPQGFSFLLMAHQLLCYETQEIVIAGTSYSSKMYEFIETMRTTYLPFAVSVVYVGALPDVLDMYAVHIPLNGQATAYICKNYVCQLPTTSLDEFRNSLVALS